MDNNTDVIELLDILYGMITEAWGVPLGNDKCIIEREKAIEIINEIKTRLPSSIAEAKRLVAARDEFIGNAKREAESMRKSAEEKARSMIEEQEIVRVARARSSEMINSAEAKSKELRRVASEYVDEIMSSTESGVSEALTKLQTAHNAFKSLGGMTAAEPEKEEKPRAAQPAPNKARPGDTQNMRRQQTPQPGGGRHQGAPITKIQRES
ncbi:MAG: hypothetical protein ACOX68_02010 [Candidatus Limivicinus sp.]|jgi:hypothetical protein